jgi:hypothetical protein
MAGPARLWNSQENYQLHLKKHRKAFRGKDHYDIETLVTYGNVKGGQHQNIPKLDLVKVEHLKGSTR